MALAPVSASTKPAPPSIVDAVTRFFALSAALLGTALFYVVWYSPAIWQNGLWPFTGKILLDLINVLSLPMATLLMRLTSGDRARVYVAGALEGAAWLTTVAFFFMRLLSADNNAQLIVYNVIAVVRGLALVLPVLNARRVSELSALLTFVCFAYGFSELIYAVACIDLQFLTQANTPLMDMLADFATWGKQMGLVGVGLIAPFFAWSKRVNTSIP
jgi:hypothetical protein